METKLAQTEGKFTDKCELVSWGERRAYTELAAQWGYGMGRDGSKGDQAQQGVIIVLPRGEVEAKTAQAKPVIEGEMSSKVMATPRNADMNKRLASRYRDAKAAGFELKGKAGYESMWYFDPTVPAQAKIALKSVGARFRKTIVLTEEQKTAVAARLSAGRASRIPIPA